MIMTAKWYSGTLCLKLTDIWLTGEEKPRKNLIQETCPDRESNPGPLRDMGSCYRLLHRGGQFLLMEKKSVKCQIRIILFSLLVEIKGFGGFKYLVVKPRSRPRWSRGYHTRFWFQGSRVRSRPGSMDFFPSVKIRRSRVVDLRHVKGPQA